MRRIVNIRPQPGTGLLLAALPFVLLVAAYLIGSQARLARQPERQAAAGLLDHRRRHARDGAGPGPALGRLPVLDRHGRQPRPARDRHRSRRPGGAGAGDRRSASCRPMRGHALGLRGHAGDDPALGRAADPLHRLRPGRALEGDADRDRHRTLPRARHRVPGPRAAARAPGQGADPGGVELADRDPDRRAHDPAAADHLPSASSSGRPGCS